MSTTMWVIAYQRQDQLEKALDSYRHALILKPDNPDVYTNMGCSIWKSKVSGKRHSTVANMPWHWSLTILMSTTRWVSCIKSQGQWEKALDSYRHALILKPDNPDVYTNMGLVYGRARSAGKGTRQLPTCLDTEAWRSWCLHQYGFSICKSKVSGKRHSTVANMPWHWSLTILVSTTVWV